MTNIPIRQHLARSWRHHFGLQIATIFVLAVVLIILSFMLSAQENLRRLNNIWGDNLELTVYFKTAASQEAMSRFVSELKSRGRFSKVNFVGKDEAVRKFMTRMGRLAPGFLKSSEFENPLPATVEIAVSDSLSAKEKVLELKTLAQQFMLSEVVDDVSYGQGWIENWAGFMTSIQFISVGALILTIVLGLLVIGNSIRVSVSQRRDEIEILELVGASTHWIRLPFIVEGAVLGLMASVVAAAFGQMLQTMLYNSLKESMQFWTVMQEVAPLGVIGWIIVSGIGAIFGALGAYVCVRHLNSGWSAAERWNS